MTLEIILWLLAWFVLSEGLFIFGIIKNIEMAESCWVGWKFLSFAIGAFMMTIQSAIVFSKNTYLFDFSNGDYIYLFYEACVILVLGGLFYLNKLVVDYFNKK